MFEHLNKSRVPKPHPLTLFGDSKPLKRQIHSHSTSSSSSFLLKNLKKKAIPCQITNFDKNYFAKTVLKKRLVIKSNPNIKEYIRNHINPQTQEIPKSDPSFFFANIILPKKILGNLYEKGFFIGSNKFSQQGNGKLSSSRTLSFINNYFKY